MSLSVLSLVMLATSNVQDRAVTPFNNIQKEAEWSRGASQNQIQRVEDVKKESSVRSQNAQLQDLTQPPSPIATMTPARTPIRTYAPAATAIVYLEGETMTIVMIVAISFAVIIVIVGIAAMVYNKMKRDENTIYGAEAAPKDENYMGTVQIKARYRLTDVYRPRQTVQ